MNMALWLAAGGGHPACRLPGIQAWRLSTYIERKDRRGHPAPRRPEQMQPQRLPGEFARQWIESTKETSAAVGRRNCRVLLKPRALFKFSTKSPARHPHLLADGIKLIMKEDIIPDPVDKPLFKIARRSCSLSSSARGAALFRCVYVRISTSAFHIAAITSIEVLGILMAGWASNNNGRCSAACARPRRSSRTNARRSRDSPASPSAARFMQGMIYDQFGALPAGNVEPGWFCSGISSIRPCSFSRRFPRRVAECNRTPFDIPEAESNSFRYHTEYCGMRFAFFFMGEYAMMCVTSAIA